MSTPQASALLDQLVGEVAAAQRAHVAARKAADAASARAASARTAARSAARSRATAEAKVASAKTPLRAATTALAQARTRLDTATKELRRAVAARAARGLSKRAKASAARRVKRATSARLAARAVWDSALKKRNSASRTYEAASKAAASARASEATATKALASADKAAQRAATDAATAQTRWRTAVTLVEQEEARLAAGRDSTDLLVARLTAGHTAALAEEIQTLGPDAWLEEQLHPTTVDHPTVESLDAWFPRRRHSPQQRFDNERAETVGSWDYAETLGNATLLRRIHSRWQLREVMAEFWSDHLHIPATAEGAYWRQQYDDTIRSQALGKFSNLLVEATFSPAMLYYLGTFSSTAGVVNENHPRELLELHTVGVGFYSEDDVKACGRILSGWTVDPWANPRTFHAHYVDVRHNTTPASVAGFASDGAGRNGETAKQFVAHLARHPNTARHLMRKLAVRLVRDDPSPALIADLVKVYLASDTDVVPVLRALVGHPDFAASRHHKVRTEEGDFVATIRALNITVKKPTAQSDAAHNLVYGYGAPMPYMWPRPDGRPDTAEAFSDPGRMLRSFTMHYALLSHWWPKGNITYPDLRSLLPTSTDALTLHQIVSHVHRTVTGRASSPELIIAACAAIGETPETVIDPGSWQHEALGSWLAVRLLTLIFDNPDHLTH